MVKLFSFTFLYIIYILLLDSVIRSGNILNNFGSKFRSIPTQISQISSGVLFSYEHIRDGRGTVYSVDRWSSLFQAVKGRFPSSALEDKRIVFNEASVFFQNGDIISICCLLRPFL